MLPSAGRGQCWSHGSPTTAMQPSLGLGDQHSSGTAWGTPGAPSITHAWRSHSVIRIQIWGGTSPHTCATQRLLRSQEAEPGASSRNGTPAVAGCLQVHLPRVLGSMGNESLEASCVLSPILLISKHWWHQDRAEKGKPCWYLVPLQPLLVQPPQMALPGCSQRSPGELFSPSTEPRFLPFLVYVLLWQQAPGKSLAL